MKRHVLLLVLLLTAGIIYSQDREIVKASSGENLAEVASTTIQYVFPEFTDGEVYYRSAAKGSGKINYNMLIGEMQFISPEGQILALANVSDVIMVTIGNRKFYPYTNHKEFTEEIVSGKVQLRVKRKGNAATHSKMGAYGTSSSTSSISSYSSIHSGATQYDLKVQENILITVNNLYYLITDSKYIQVKNQKQFLKQFPDHKDQIEEYIKENQISFNKEENLVGLLKYCNSL